MPARCSSSLRAAIVAALCLAASACGDGPVAPNDDFRVEHVSAGAEHTCAIDSDGTGWCWGRSLLNQTGARSDEHPCTTEAFCLAPARVWTPLELDEVSAGGTHTCTLANGSAFCWGSDWRGQLGGGRRSYQRCGNLPCSVEPVRAALGARLVDVTAGANHSCALTAAGEAYCWGYAHFGQVGDGVARDSTRLAVLVAGGHHFEQISAGTSHTCAVDADAQAWCWGADLEGRLGLGEVRSSPVPAPVTGDPTSEDPARRERLRWSAIEAGVSHTCGITVDGEVYCWGQNMYGQLGAGDERDSAVPRHAPLPGVAIDVAVGEHHTCAVTDDGAAYCWGRGLYGRLGTGNQQWHSAPHPVLLDTRLESITAGLQHTCALTEAGRVYCWGQGYYGQTAAGNRGYYSVPQPIALR